MDRARSEPSITSRDAEQSYQFTTTRHLAFHQYAQGGMDPGGERQSLLSKMPSEWLHGTWRYTTGMALLGLVIIVSSPSLGHRSGPDLE